jgi:hypothetical protein
METDINFNSLITSVGKCCLGEQDCGTCSKENCLVGYCKKNLLTCLKTGEQFIDGEIDNIPLFDTKVFDEKSIIETIGLILNECKNCNAYHDEECIINMLRSSCEVILFGNPMDYNGSALLYLEDVKQHNAEISSKIFDAFKNAKG